MSASIGIIKTSFRLDHPLTIDIDVALNTQALKMSGKLNWVRTKNLLMRIYKSLPNFLFKKFRDIHGLQNYLLP